VPLDGEVDGAGAAVNCVVDDLLVLAICKGCTSVSRF
jgi:hypothetical protein